MDGFLVLIVLGVIWCIPPYLLVKRMSKSYMEAQQARGYNVQDGGVPDSWQVVLTLLFGWVWAFLYWFFFYLPRKSSL